MENQVKRLTNSYFKSKMKRNLKNAMYAMLAAGMFASCTTTEDITSEVPVTGGDGEETALNLKISYQQVHTYAMETPVGATTTPINEASLFIVNASGAVLKYYRLTSTQCTNISTPTGIHIEKVPSTMAEVLLVANDSSNLSAADWALFKAAATKSDVLDFPFTVELQQGSAHSPVATGINHVTMMGLGTVSGVKPDPLGHTVNYREAKFNIRPIVGRMEFLADLTEGTGLQAGSLVIDSIYFNNFYTTNEKSLIAPAATLLGNNHQYFYGDTTTPGWSSGIESGWPAVMKDDVVATQPAAASGEVFQFFADSLVGGVHTQDYKDLPHILLKVHATLSDGTTPISGWITINKYYISGSVTDVLDMEANTVYKINGPITIDAGHITPNPEPAEVHLGVFVTIVPWTVVSLDPNL